MTHDQVSKNVPDARQVQLLRPKVLMVLRNFVYILDNGSFDDSLRIIYFYSRF